MIQHKLRSAIDALQLDLTGKIVLTEAASGYYVVTPIIAAMAGAKVLAFTRDTAYGSVESVRQETLALASKISSSLSIDVLSELTPDLIASADVITNSGHLRSLDQSKLQFAKRNAVIPLMYEAWEFRENDIDIAFARSRNIRVAGTNERHPEVDVFGYLGDMAIRLIQDAEITPYRNSFVLVCNNDFGPYIARTLSKICGQLGVIGSELHRDQYLACGAEWIGEFPMPNVSPKWKDAEAILFTANPFPQTWISNGGTIDTKWFISNFNHPLVLRYAGDIHPKDCLDAGIRFFPSEVKSGHMGVIPSAVGPDPVIRLQAGSLKVAECMMKGQIDFKGIPLVQYL